MTVNEMYDFLRDKLMISEEALALAFTIGGWNKETAQDILYFYTGFNDFEGYLNELKD